MTMKKRRGAPKKERIPGIGEYLTQIRELQGKTQQEIAARIERNKSFICRIEREQREQRSLRGDILFEIALAYGISVEDVQRRAHWPQFILPLDITAEEMQELMQHLKRMRERKRRQQPRSPE